MKQFRIGKSITNRKDETLNLYLKDISKIPLITAEEEIELAKKIQQGDKKALDKLISANLRFVISVAKQYQGQGIPLIDLISSGNEGLSEAAKRFDYTKGFKFISYAVWWIRQSIIKSLALESRTIRVPISQSYPYAQLQKVISEFESKYERTPSNKEIAKIMKISESKVVSLIEGNLSCVSVDSPFNSEDEDGTLLDVIPNKNIPTSDASLKEEDMYKGLDILLNNFSDQDSDIIKMSFGLEGVQYMPYEEIGKRFGLTGERIRQKRIAIIETIKKKYLNLAKELL